MTAKPSPSRKSYTPPKRQQTVSRAELEQEARARSDRQANLQWAAVIIVGVVLFGLLVIFGSGTGGSVDHVQVGGHG